MEISPVSINSRAHKYAFIQFLGLSEVLSPAACYFNADGKIFKERIAKQWSHGTMAAIAVLTERKGVQLVVVCFCLSANL